MVITVCDLIEKFECAGKFTMCGNNVTRKCWLIADRPNKEKICGPFSPLVQILWGAMAPCPPPSSYTPAQASHPSDPNNPNKFKKFGGGVLIAIRSDIQADVKRLSARKGAEILAIKVSIDNKKFVFCTLYRVGNLDEHNHASIINTIKTFYDIRSPRKIFIIGDFNLSSVSWPLSEVLGNANSTEKLFTDSFDELGLDQCILGSPVYPQ